MTTASSMPDTISPLSTPNNRSSRVRQRIITDHCNFEIWCGLPLCPDRSPPAVTAMQAVRRGIRARPSVYSSPVRNLRLFTDLPHHEGLWIICCALVQRCAATMPEDRSSDDPMMLILAELKILNRTARCVDAT